VSKTFLGMQLSVYSWLGKETSPGVPDTNALPLQVCKDLINEAQAHLAEEADWTWTEDIQSLTITAGNSSAPFPYSLIKPTQVRYVDTDGSTVILVPYLTPAAMLEDHHQNPTALWYPSDQMQQESPQPITDPGKPLAWCPWGRAINLERPTLNTIAFSIYGTWYPPDLVNDTDHSYLTDSDWMLLLLQTLTHSTIFGFEDERVQMWEAQYQEHLGLAKSIDAALRGSAGYYDTREPG
jgi:hypothetical protein